MKRQIDSKRKSIYNKNINICNKHIKYCKKSEWTAGVSCLLFLVFSRLFLSSLWRWQWLDNNDVLLLHWLVETCLWTNNCVVWHIIYTALSKCFVCFQFNNSAILSYPDLTMYLDARHVHERKDHGSSPSLIHYNQSQRLKLDLKDRIGPYFLPRGNQIFIRMFFLRSP